LFSRERIGLANDPQNVYPPTPPRVVFVLIMGSIAGGSSSLSVAGSIVGIVALLISLSAIIQALVTYFASYRDAPVELNRLRRQYPIQLMKIPTDYAQAISLSLLA